jgi:hypothetical protein
MLSDLTATSFTLSDFVKPKDNLKLLEESRTRETEGHAKRLENDKDIHLLLCWAH